MTHQTPSRNVKTRIRAHSQTLTLRSEPIIALFTHRSYSTFATFAVHCSNTSLLWEIDLNANFKFRVHTQ